MHEVCLNSINKLNSLDGIYTEIISRHEMERVKSMLTLQLHAACYVVLLPSTWRGETYVNCGV